MKIEIISDWWTDVTRDEDGDICLNNPEFRIYWKDTFPQNKHFYTMVADLIEVLTLEQKIKVEKLLKKKGAKK